MRLTYLVPYFQTLIPHEDDPAGDPAGGQGAPAPKTYSQEEFDAAVAQHTSVQQELMTELETLKGKSNLTKQQRAELEDRVRSLNEKLLSKEQLAEKEKERLIQERKAEVTGLTSERDTWRSRFENTRIETDILSNASHKDAEAHNPAQLLRFLKPDSKIEPVLDADGKETGNYETYVTVDLPDKTGKMVPQTLTPKEAIKAMAKTDEYANLFKNGGTGGAGIRHKNGSPMTQVEAAKHFAGDPQGYRDWKIANKIP